MKKIIAVLTLLAVFSGASLFAQEDTSSDKVMGGSVGASLSILGLAPEVSFIYKNFEAGMDFPMLSGSDYKTDEDLFGVGIGVFGGYISDPWTRGYQSAFGFNFHYLPKDYIHASIFGESLDEDFDTSGGAKILAFYYRGTAKFSPNVGLNFRVALPLYAGFGGSDSVSIINSHTGWVCWLMALGSIGIGMRVEF